MNGGGAERLLASIFRPLNELGVENDLATLWSGNVYGPQVEPYVRRCELGVAEHGRVRGLRSLVRMSKDVDAVSTHLTWGDLYGRTAALMGGRPSFSTLHVTWYSPENISRQPRGRQMKIRVLQQLEALTARSTRGLFAVSEAVRDVYATALRLPRESILVSPNFVDLEIFSADKAGDRSEIRASLGISEEEFLILTVARLAPQKDYTTAIRAVADLHRERPVRYLIVGGGPDEARLHALAAETGAPVTFLGLRRDVPRLLHAADLFLFPTFFEGMSVALLEAMGMGTPCLCSDIVENREAAAECAVYFPPGDAAVLEKELRNLIADPDLRARLAHQGRERTLRLYDSRVAAKRFVDTVSGSLKR